MTKKLMKIDIAIMHQVFIGMFGKAIILGDNSSYTIPINGNMEEYRIHIKDKIMEYMHTNSTLPNEYDFDKLKLNRFLFKCTINIQESVSKEIPFRGDAMTYLGQIASRYLHIGNLWSVVYVKRSILLIIRTTLQSNGFIAKLVTTGYICHVSE